MLSATCVRNWIVIMNESIVLSTRRNFNKPNDVLIYFTLVIVMNNKDNLYLCAQNLTEVYKGIQHILII